MLATNRKFFNFLLLIGILLLHFNITFTQVSKLEDFILLDEMDSARLLIKKIDSPKKPMFYRFINDTYTNEDVIEFIGSMQSENKRQFKLIQHFVEGKMVPPKSTEKIDLEYVRLMWYYTNVVRNEYSLEIASEIDAKNKQYVKKIKDQTTVEAKKASIYLNTHSFIMNIIQGNLNEAEKMITKDLKLAVALKDTFLIFTTRYYMGELLTSQRKLEEFIKFQRETIAGESEMAKKSGYFSLTIESLVDALLFSKNYDPIEIENYLKLLLNDPGSVNHCLPLYAKYVGSIALDSDAARRIFTLFEVDNISDFADKLIEIGVDKVNKHELIQMYGEIAYMLKKHKAFEKAFEILEKEDQLTKEIYSGDLAQAIASFEKLKIQEEKEEAIEHEKMKQKYYIFSTVISTLFLFISILFLIRNRKYSKVLMIKNKEKEVLLREIHHRVKNNFQTISSLLDFQLKDIEDQKAISRIREGQSRLKSMSLIHEKLYQNQEDVATVNLHDYTVQLSKQILGIYGKEDVQVEVEIDKIELDIDTAIPLGLILNEVITNSCKYAFEQGNGLLKIVAQKIKSGQYHLTIQDNGPGLPDNLQLKNLSSLGMKLITRLTKQLHGDVQFLNESGVCIQIQFKDTFERKLIQ